MMKCPDLSHGLLHRGSLVVLLLAACVTAGHAEDVSGWYFGVNGGIGRNEYKTAFVDNQYRSQAAAAGDTLTYDSNAAHRDEDVWWVDTGYLPWAYLGLEAEFFHLPEFTHRNFGTAVSSNGNESVITVGGVTSHGPALSLIGRLPLTDAFEADIHVGDYLGKSSLVAGLQVGSNYEVSTVSTTRSSLLAGVGGAYTFAGHWSVRFDFLHFNKVGDGHEVGQFDVNMLTVGAAFTF
jgi:hypothetical protein